MVTSKNSEHTVSRAFSARLSMVLLAANLFASGPLEGKEWTSRESVQMTRYVPEPQSFMRGRSGNPIGYSPDAKFVYVWSTRGQISCDCVLQTLRFYRTIDLKNWLNDKGPKPSPSAIVQMKSREPTGISIDPNSLVWSDAATLVFIGKDKEGNNQVYRLHAENGRLEQLTRNKLVKFWPSPIGDSVLYRVNIPNRPLADPYPFSGITRNDSGKLPELERDVHVGWIIRANNGAEWQLPIGDIPGLFVDVSPDRGRAVLIEREFFPGDHKFYPRAFLVNLRTKRVKPLRLKRPAPPVNYQYAVRWVGGGDPIIGSKESDRPAARQAVELEVEQDANNPPKLLARMGSRSKTLSSPDPVLEGVSIAKVKPFSWQEGGKKITGGLTLPVNDSGRPPLVIQAYFYDPTTFLPDGVGPTAYAMQSLVAQGFAVLQLNILDLPGFATKDEGPQFVKRIDAAIAALAEDRLVDPSKVGLVGHSRAGFLTYYAITHPGSYRIAAAEVADSVQFSLIEYLYNGGAGGSGPEVLNGGPFWSNQREWLDHDATLNVDKVTTPTLFLDIHNSKGRSMHDLDLQAMSAIGAFELLHRPYDFMFFPTGVHALARPLERISSLEATVNWMNFWIMGKVASNPSNADQMATWQVVKDKWLIQQLWEKGGHPPTSVPDVNFANEKGYEALYLRSDISGAISFFRGNLALHPENRAVLQDSLGEAFLQQGDVKLALKHYGEAVSADPQLATGARSIIAELRDDPSSLRSLQEKARASYFERHPQ